MLELMKQYKNISNQRLHIDCMSHTVHMEPEETLFLPLSRDVRYNTRQRNLAVVKERKEILSSKDNLLPRPKLAKKQWKQSKSNIIKPDSNSEKMETE